MHQGNKNKQTCKNNVKNVNKVNKSALTTKNLFLFMLKNIYRRDKTANHHKHFGFLNNNKYLSIECFIIKKRLPIELILLVSAFTFRF